MVAFCAMIFVSKIGMCIYVKYGKIIETLIKCTDSSYGNTMLTAENGHEFISFYIIFCDFMYFGNHRFRRGIFRNSICKKYALFINFCSGFNVVNLHIFGSIQKGFGAFVGAFLPSAGSIIRNWDQYNF